MVGDDVPINHTQQSTICTDLLATQLSTTSNLEITKQHTAPEEPLNCNSEPNHEKDGYIESNEETSEDDDSGEDETYKMDPRELFHCDYDDVVEQVGGKKKQHRSKTNEVDVDLVNGDDDGGLSENSVQLDDIVQEELEYDVDELMSFRRTNLGLRKEQKERVGPLSDCLKVNNTSKSMGERGHIEVEGVRDQVEVMNNQTDVMIGNSWPTFLTTFEGGYQSDQRDSEFEGPLYSSSSEEGEVTIKKRSKRVHYPSFNEKSDMANVQFTAGLRFTSQSVLKLAILWYSIQQHKDLI